MGDRMFSRMLMLWKLSWHWASLPAHSLHVLSSCHCGLPHQAAQTEVLAEVAQMASQLWRMTVRCGLCILVSRALCPETPLLRCRFASVDMPARSATSVSQ